MHFGLEIPCHGLWNRFSANCAHEHPQNKRSHYYRTVFAGLYIITKLHVCRNVREAPTTRTRLPQPMTITGIAKTRRARSVRERLIAYFIVLRDVFDADYSVIHLEACTLHSYPSTPVNGR